MEPKTRLERFLAAIAGDDVSLDLPKTRIEKYLARILARVSHGGSGGSSLPAVTSSDNGKVLGVVDGAWAASEQGKKFIVTLTPTALDYSGTMDKTANEITAAYEAGQEIMFNVVGFPGFDHVYIPAAWCTYATDNPNCAACATLVEVGTGMQIIIVTSDADGGTTYSTYVYTLTPAS